MDKGKEFMMKGKGDFGKGKDFGMDKGKEFMMKGKGDFGKDFGKGDFGKGDFGKGDFGKDGGKGFPAGPPPGMGMGPPPGMDGPPPAGPPPGMGPGPGERRCRSTTQTRSSSGPRTTCPSKSA